MVWLLVGPCYLGFCAFCPAYIVPAVPALWRGSTWLAAILVLLGHALLEPYPIWVLQLSPTPTNLCGTYIKERLRCRMWQNYLCITGMEVSSTGCHLGDLCAGADCHAIAAAGYYNKPTWMVHGAWDRCRDACRHGAGYFTGTDGSCGQRSRTDTIALLAAAVHLPPRRTSAAPCPAYLPHTCLMRTAFYLAAFTAHHCFAVGCGLVGTVSYSLFISRRPPSPVTCYPPPVLPAVVCSGCLARSAMHIASGEPAVADCGRYATGYGANGLRLLHITCQPAARFTVGVVDAGSGSRLHSGLDGRTRYLRAYCGCAGWYGLPFCLCGISLRCRFAAPYYFCAVAGMGLPACLPRGHALIAAFSSSLSLHSRCIGVWRGTYSAVMAASLSGQRTLVSVLAVHHALCATAVLEQLSRCAAHGCEFIRHRRRYITNQICSCWDVRFAVGSLRCTCAAGW